MDVLNRLSLNARVMDKIIKLFYKSVVLYDKICKDQEETAEDLLLMKIQTIKKFDHDWREYLYKKLRGQREWTLTRPLRGVLVCSLPGEDRRFE